MFGSIKQRLLYIQATTNTSQERTDQYDTPAQSGHKHYVYLLRMLKT